MIMPDRRYRWMDRALALRPDFLELLDGDHRAAIFLSQAVYWQTRTENDWFWKTAEDWESETWVPPSAQQRVRAKLREYDFWHEKREGMPAKLHFYIDLEALENAIVNEVVDPSVNRSVTGGQNKSGGNAQTYKANPPNKSGGNTQTDAPPHNARATRSETTKETTNKDSQRRDAHPPACEEFFDLDRDPIPERDRMDLMQFQSAWRNATGENYQISRGNNRDRALCLLAHFTEREVRGALQVTKRRATGPPWGYFSAVLESDQKPSDNKDNRPSPDDYHCMSESERGT